MKNHFVLDRLRTLRTVGPAYSLDTLPKGEMHLHEVAFTLENSHDQPVVVQVQGKDRFGVVWQDIGLAQTVSAIAGVVPGVLSLKVFDPWDVLRLEYTSAVAPLTGSILATAVGHING